MIKTESVVVVPIIFFLFKIEALSISSKKKSFNLAELGYS